MIGKKVSDCPGPNNPNEGTPHKVAICKGELSLPIKKDAFCASAAKAPKFNTPATE